MNLELDENVFCSTCYSCIIKKKIPTLCLDNGFRYLPVPACISKLNRIEERLVSARHVFQSIWTVAGAHGQFRHKGAITNIPVNVDTTVNQLPRKLSDTNILTVKLARRMSHDKSYMQGNVDVENVLEAALLLANSETYKKHNITIDSEWLEVANEFLRNLDSEMETEDVEIGAGDGKDITEDDIPVGANETFFSGDDGIKMAPGDGVSPLSLLTDVDSESLSFPKIFVGQQMEPISYGKPVTYGSIIKSLIRHHDRRAVRADFLFYMDTKRLLKHLVSKVSIMLRKSKPGVGDASASTVLDEEQVDGLINSDAAFKVFSTVRNSPAYWKAEKSNLMAMIRQLGIPTFFITLSAAETKWPELIVILKKLIDSVDITEDDVAEMSSAEITRLIQSDAPTCARYFDRRFRHLKATWKPPHGPFGNYELVDYYYRIEFQARGSPHVHMMILLKDAPVFTADPNNELDVCRFVDSIISCKIIDPNEDPVLAEMVNGRQVHRHTRTCYKKGNRNGVKICRFNIPFFPMDKTRVLHPFLEDEKLSPELRLLKELNVINGKKVRKYLNENMLMMVNSDMSFDDFLEVLDLNLDTYLKAVQSTLSCSKVMLKRKVKEVMINNYNPMILRMHRANIDLQYILDPYACCVYIVDYINKSDRGMTRVLEKVISESVNKGAPTKTLLRNLTSKFYTVSEVSAQEASYNLLQLKMVESSAKTIFIPSTPEFSRSRMLKSTAELKKLPPNSKDIYLNGWVEYYQYRPDSLKDLNLAQFCAWYEVMKHKKKGQNDDGDDEGRANDDLNPDEEDDVIQGFSKGVLYIPLKEDIAYIRKRKRAKIIRYYRPDIKTNPEYHFYSLVMLYLPWSNQKEDLEDKDCEEIFKQNIVIINNNMLEFSKIPDDTILRFMEEADIRSDLRDNTGDSDGEEEEDGPPVDGNKTDDFSMYSLPDDEGINFNASNGQTSSASSSRPNRASAAVAEGFARPDKVDNNEYYALISKLNMEQRNCFNYILNYVRHEDCKQNPLRLFDTGGAGTGKSLLIKILYQSLIRFYDVSRERDLEKPSVVLCAFTGKAAYNIGGQTIHSLFHLPINQDDIQDLSSDVANSMSVILSELQVIILDEISMVSSRHLLWIDKRLRDVFKTDKPFGGKHVLVFGDFLQLPPVHDFAIYSGFPKNTMKHLRVLELWHSFKVHRLTEIMRQRDDAKFAIALNNMARGTMSTEDISLFQSRTFKSLPQQATAGGVNLVRLYATNKLVDQCNAETISVMNTPKFVSVSFDSVSGQGGNAEGRRSLLVYASDITLPYHKTGSLVKELQLQIEARYMLTSNIDTSDGLVNGTTGYLIKVDCGQSKNNTCSKPLRVWLKMEDERCGKKRRTEFKNVSLKKNYPSDWTPFDPISNTFRRGKVKHISIERTQFPMVIAEALTIHKSQGATYSNVVLDLSKGSYPTRSSLYVACSRATSASGLFIISGKQFQPTVKPKETENISLELVRLDSVKLVPKFYSLINLERQNFQLLFHNVQSLNAHLDQIINDNVYLSSDILLFAETWSVSRQNIKIPSFSEVARVNVLGDLPRPYGAVCYINDKILSKLNARTKIEMLWRNNEGSISIAGFTTLDLTILSVYISPRCNFTSALQKLESCLNDSITNSKIIVAGDFNLNFNEDSTKMKVLTEMLQKFSLKSVFCAPFSTTNNGTFIDNIYTNFNPIESGRYISYTSHHDPLFIQF